MSRLQSRLTLKVWRASTAEDRRAAAQEIAAQSGGALELVRTAGEDEVPVFLHVPSQVLFHLVPGGTWRLGFSEEEREAVHQQYQGWPEADADDAICNDPQQLPDPYEVALPAFLLAGRPLDAEQLALLRSDEPPQREGARRQGRKLWNYDAVVNLPADEYVRYLQEVEEGTLSEQEIEAIEERLRLRGLRLPTNDEWEAAARAGGNTPFPCGTAIPKSPSTGVNRFGFVDMGAWPEVVAGTWIHGGDAPCRAVRGGAAMVYPGQGCGEWTLMLCAMRGGAKEMDELLHVRPAMELAEMAAVKRGAKPGVGKPAARKPERGGGDGATDKVDWKSLRTARGPASRVPALVRALIRDKSADDGNEVYRALRDGLRGDGGGVVPSSAAPTVPLLCEVLASGKEGAHKAGWLIAEALTAGHQRVFADAAAEVTGAVAAVRAAVAKQKGVLLAAVTDGDPRVRSAAAFALAWATALAPESLPVLRKQAAAETSEEAALSELLAIGLLASGQGDTTPVNEVRVDSPLARGGVALARVLNGRPVESIEIAGVIAVMQAHFDEGAPWCEGQYGRVVVSVASRAGVRPEMAVAIAAGLDPLAPPSTWAAPVSALLTLGGFEARWGRFDVALPEELTDVQRAVATSLARRDGIQVGWGLPPSGRDRRRWLGLTPAGPLEKRVKHEEHAWPLWKVWRVLYEGRRSDSEGLPRSIAEHLDPDETVEALAEVCTDAYLILSSAREAGRHPTATKVIVDAAGQVGPRAARWARAYADEILALVKARSQQELGGVIGMLGNLPCLLAILNTGGTIEPRWFRFVPLQPTEHARLVLEKMPPPQREAAVWERMNEPGAVDPLNDFIVRGCVPVLDLVPSKRIIDTLVARIGTAKPANAAEALARIEAIRSKL